MNRAKHLIGISACYSHVGTVRKINEDACLELSECGLWAVADGMGGHEAGDVASQMIMNSLRQIPPPSSLEDAMATVKRHLQEVNGRLRKESAQHYQHRVIGSTVAILLLHEDQGACLWVGDSRVYRLRDSQLQQLTRDHSHVQDLIEQGLLQPHQAHNHPMANVITRAVGAADELTIDVLTFPLQTHDVFLLCSDGLNKAVADAEIADLLTYSDSQEIVHALIHLALIRGANDNVTTVVVIINDEGSDATGQRGPAQ